IARSAPTIVASSPIARCRKPPTFALAYISPARSSKRRISSIAYSHSRATSGSGSGRDRPPSALCSASATWSAMSRGHLSARAPGRNVASDHLDVRALAPCRHELLGAELREVALELAREPARRGGGAVPEQLDLARVDAHDLDVVHALGICQERRRRPAAGDDHAVRAVGLHAASRS